MNKEFEKFHCDNRGIISDLLESLDVLLSKFNQGIVPGEPEKSDALYVLSVYKDALEHFEGDENPVFQRIKSEVASFDAESVYEELLGERERISLLMKLGREKIIAVDDVIFQSNAGKDLLQRGYCDELILEESGKYYSLSEKAEMVFRNKALAGKLRKENVMAIAPAKMILAADKWSNLYVRRVAILKQYYMDKGKDYILFTLDDEQEMVFGCELNESLDVIYTFAGIFDGKRDKQMSKLKEFAGSGLIDNIIVLVESDEGNEMFDTADMKQTEHIVIERL